MIPVDGIIQTILIDVPQAIPIVVLRAIFVDVSQTIPTAVPTSFLRSIALDSVWRYPTSSEGPHPLELSP